MSQKSKGKYCAAVNCHNNQGRNKDKSFFSFPLNPERCKKWVINTRRKDLFKRDCTYLHKNCRICSDHFEEVWFVNFEKNRLKGNAVPTLFNVPSPPNRFEVKGRKVMRNESVQTSVETCASISCPTNNSAMEKVPASEKIHIPTEEESGVKESQTYPGGSFSTLRKQALRL